MAAKNILKKTILMVLVSITGVFALIFILSKFIDVNVDSMGGNTVYPPYSFLQETSINQYEQAFPMDTLVNTSLLTDDNSGYESSVYYWGLEQENQLELSLDVLTAGDYYISLDILSNANNVKPNEITIDLNGNSDSDYVNVRLLTQWAKQGNDTTFDIYNNEVYDQNIPYTIWNEILLRDQLFLNDTPLKFTFEQGINTLTIKKEQGEFYLGAVKIYEAKNYLTYQEYLNLNQSSDTSGQMITLEAESYTFKNNVSIIPEMEKTPSVSPFNTDLNYLNIIGTSFNEVGNQLTYYFNVENNGYYNITLKYKNNYYDNRNVFRNIYINHDIPFENLNGYAFSSTSTWENETLGDGTNHYNFYFHEGLNSITLEADISKYKDDYLRIQEIIQGITTYSIDLKKLTGGETDRNREWDIASFLPDTQNLFDSWYADLDEIYHHVSQMSTNQRQSTEISKQLELALSKLFILKSDINEIPHETYMLSTGTNSLSQILSLVNNALIDQPLSLDKIYIHSEDQKVPNASAFFLNKWIASMQIYQKASSFKTTDDYDIEIWVNRSRYYISMMQQMTDSTFTPQTGIKVKYSVMPNESKLILANAADTQPDMALGVSAWLPYELGLRGAAADMRQFDGFTDVIQNFMPGSYLNMIYDEKVYGLPETEDFQVTYYRKDILEALNLEVPNTYNDIKEILPTLQRYGMNYYLPLSADSALKPFSATSPFIHQFGSEFYSSDGMDVLIDSEAAMEGINTMVELYTVYSLALQTPNFYNAFREASIPIGLSSFNTYVQLTFAAPEISNAWDIALAPGYEIEPGVINRDNTGAAQASIIFEKSDKKAEAFELLKWWMSTQTQTDFIYNLLVTYGDGFLWNSANVNAFKTLPIPQKHIDIILEQWEYLHEVPKVPGGYKTERELSNVWNSVVFDGVDVRSAVDDAVLLIRRELERKYQEFGYVDTDGIMIRPYIITTREDVIGWMEGDN